MVRVVKERDSVDAKSLAADLIACANQAAPSAVAVIPLVIAFDRLTVGATDKLVLCAPALAVHALPAASTAGELLVASLARNRAWAVTDHPH